ncbi:MAG TPA: hypothetical protein VGG40_05170 [Solirubrobacterales bacterium]
MEAQAAERTSTAKPMRWEDWVAYGFLLAGVYFLVGALFFYAGKEKIFDGVGAPAGIQKQFAGTFLDTIPGTDAAWTILGILEFAIFVLVVISLLRLEFLPNRAKPWLLSALGLAVFTFSILAVGQNVTGESSGVAELYIYAGATGVLFFLVLQLPPYRAANWISGRVSR